ncbi:MAG TPA: hypothetical protein VGH42_08220 [Verrucomicrobiae bacterium]
MKVISKGNGTITLGKIGEILQLNKLNQLFYFGTVIIIIWLCHTHDFAKTRKLGSPTNKKISLQASAVTHDVRREFRVNLTSIRLRLMQSTEPTTKMTSERILSVATLSTGCKKMCSSGGNKSARKKGNDKIPFVHP